MKTKSFLFILLGILLISNSSFSQLKKIVDFNSSQIGLDPITKLVNSGDFIFGATKHGGDKNYGVIFKLTKSGLGYTIIHSFDSINGAYPIGNVYVKDDYIFGITEKGGQNNFGVIFKIKNDGSDFKVIFNNPDYKTIDNFLIVDTVIYGSCNHWSPTEIIKISVNGKGFKTIGSYGNSSMGTGHDLCFAKDSFLYGTGWGGLNTYGVVFKIKFDGSNYTKLIDFDKDNTGSYPSDIFVQNDKIYGVSNQGGLNNYGTIFSMGLIGENFNVLFNGYQPGFNYLMNLTHLNNTLYCTTETGTIFSINNYGKNIYKIAEHNTWDSTFYCPSIIDSSLFSFVYSPSYSFNKFLVKYDINKNNLGNHICSCTEYIYKTDTIKLTNTIHDTITLTNTIHDTVFVEKPNVTSSSNTTLVNTEIFYPNPADNSIQFKNTSILSNNPLSISIYDNSG
jgi:hypothetical protein